MIANSEDTNGSEEMSSVGAMDEDGGSDKELESKPEPEPESELVALSLDDDIIQTLFSEFHAITGSYNNGIAFYAQALNNNVSRQKIMEIAFSNLTSSTCVGDYKIGLANGETYAITACYSGAEMRQEIKKLFGFDYAFTEDDVLFRACPHGYDTQNDEFHATTIGCGGWFPAYIQRELYRAEKDKERVYLYEMAVYVTAHTESGCAGDFCRLGSGGLWDTVIEDISSENMSSLIDYPGADEIFDQFKWTFIWDGANYVFESLERI